jgi:hypothetical protein
VLSKVVVNLDRLYLIGQLEVRHVNLVINIRVNTTHHIILLNANKYSQH